MSEWLQVEVAALLKYARAKWLMFRDYLTYVLMGYRTSDLLGKIRCLQVLLDIAQARLGEISQAPDEAFKNRFISRLLQFNKLEGNHSFGLLRLTNGAQYFFHKTEALWLLDLMNKWLLDPAYEALFQEELTEMTLLFNSSGQVVVRWVNDWGTVEHNTRFTCFPVKDRCFTLYLRYREDSKTYPLSLSNEYDNRILCCHL